MHIFPPIQVALFSSYGDLSSSKIISAIGIADNILLQNINEKSYKICFFYKNIIYLHYAYINYMFCDRKRCMDIIVYKQR